MGACAHKTCLPLIGRTHAHSQTMNFKSLVFRHGSKYLTCWMLDGHIRFNDVAEFFQLGAETELGRHLEKLAEEMPKKLLRYSFNFRSGYFPGPRRDDFFCKARDVRFIVHEVQQRAGIKERGIAGVDAANEHMLEQLIEQSDDITVARAANQIYAFAELVQTNEAVFKKLKRKHPAVAAALESVPVDREAAEDGPATPVAKKKARPYDLMKRPAPPLPLHNDAAAEEIECETFLEVDE